MSTNDQIAADWRSDAWRAYAWKRAPNQAGTVEQLIEGESGGLYVHCDELPGRRAYMKPRRKTNTVRRAAREKIASDLAYDLQVNVPPALLADRQEPGSEEAHVAISLVMFPRQDSWEIVRRALDRGSSSAPLYRSKMGAASSRAWAFDTWLGQGDHHDGSPDNIVFGYDPADIDGTGRFIFLDYAFSMGHLGSWDAEKMLVCAPARIPALMQAAIDRNELSQTIEEVEAVTDDSIKEIVTRIPASHLDSQDKERIATVLSKRRSLVRSAFVETGEIQ
jgi:hypothetical protein